MIGTQEIIVILGIIAVSSIFGRKWLKDLFKLGFGAKKDFEEVKAEFETNDKKKK